MDGLPVVLVCALPAVLAAWLLAHRRDFRAASSCLLLAMSLPLLWTLAHCQLDARSEACVWSKAYLPAYLGLAAALLTPLLYLTFHLLGLLWRAWHQRQTGRVQSPD
ncbi:MAG: hypothetical protein O9341_00355 [Paucibacter sp.]|nr:hypothetical protein [Roseateles sp.]